MWDPVILSPNDLRAKNAASNPKDIYMSRGFIGSPPSSNFPALKYCTPPLF